MFNHVDDFRDSESLHDDCDSLDCFSEDDCIGESSGEEDDGTPAPRRKKGRRVLVLENALPAARTASYQTKWLYGVLSSFLSMDTI